MDAIEKKELLMKLYKISISIQATIESEIDSLIQNGNTKEFNIALLNQAEVLVLLLRSNY